MENNMEIIWIPEDMHFAVVDNNGEIVTRCIDERQAEDIISAIEENVYNESSEE